MIQRLCIIGVGLIGGSLARALRAAKACQEIVAYGRSEENLRKALQLGVIDRYERSIAAAVQGSDMVLVAVPLGAMQAVFAEVFKHIAEGAIVTDVGSAKASVVRAARAAFGEVPPFLVPGHPIAGTEQSGVEASFAELFQARRVILTPLAETDPLALQRVQAMWTLAGAEVVQMTVDHHDKVLAATSHLPHLLAYLLVDVLARMEEEEEIFRFAAGGFRDFTRIASSDPQMWHDICTANSDALLAVTARFQEELAHLTEAIQTKNSEKILATFRRAKQERDRFCG